MPLMSNAGGGMTSHGHRHGVIAISDQAVDVYGLLSMSLDYNDPGEGGDGNFYLDSGGTIVAIKGSSPVNDNLKLFWQIESTVNLTELGDLNSSEIAGHDSVVGVASPYGNVVAGKHDTPYTMTTLAFDPFHHLAGDMRVLMGNIYDLNSGSGGHHASAFNIRAPDILMYQTPEKNAFAASVALFGFNETKTTPATGDKSAFSVAGRYSMGPLFATVAYEEHKNYDSYGNHHAAVDPEMVDKTSAAKVGLMYGFSRATIGAIFETIDVEDPNPAVPNGSRDTYYLSATVPVSPRNSLKLAYGSSTKFLVDDEASFYALGATRTLSDVAQLYVSYIHAANDARAHYGTFRTTPSVDGGDPSTVSAGLLYSF